MVVPGFMPICRVELRPLAGVQAQLGEDALVIDPQHDLLVIPSLGEG